MIKTTWEHTCQTEAKRLLHTAHQIAVYFYQINGFLVLPQSPKQLPLNSVIFPELAYTDIPRFFDKARKIDVGTPIEAEPGLVGSLATLIEKYEIQKGKNDGFTGLQKAWSTKSEEILSTIAYIIPDYSRLLSTLTIHPTNYGTRQSFNVLDKTHRDLKIYVRVDATIGTITEAIISALTRKFVTKSLSGTWAESEIIPDWLLTQSRISKLVGNGFVPTLNSTRNTELSRHKSASDNYLNKLGFSIHKDTLKIDDNQIVYEGKPVLGLNAKEESVLHQLVECGQIATDELADIIFTDDKDFSLYAMAKFVQRLRNKLEHNGLTGSVIQTVRGYGFVLK